MDIRTLAKVLQEANRVLPVAIRESIATGLDKFAEALGEFGDAFDEATQLSSEDNFKDVVDNVTNDAVLKSFDDLVKDFNAAEQPAAPAQQPGGTSLNSLIDDIYTYVSSNSEAYLPWNEDNREWNLANPLYIVLDFVQMLSEEEIVRRFQAQED